jgi:hypothetical protein
MTDTDQTEDEPMRAFTRQLFAKGEPDEPDEQQKPPGNFVPREGNLSQPKDNPDLQVIRDLFDA